MSDEKCRTVGPVRHPLTLPNPPSPLSNRIYAGQSAARKMESDEKRGAMSDRSDKSDTKAPALIALAGQVQALVDAGTPRHLIAHVLNGELDLEGIR